MSSDPTIDFLKQFDDPSLWEVKRNVPIFMAHVYRDGRGQLKYEATDADLDLICAEMNRLEKEDGICLRITDGHTRPGQPQAAQPTLLGYGKNYHVGPSGPSGKKALLYDEYIHKDSVGIAGQRPYRSPEFYPNEKRIRGVAMCLTDPHLDMGMISYSKDGIIYRYEMGDDHGAGCECPHCSAGDLDPSQIPSADAIFSHYVKKHPMMMELHNAYHRGMFHYEAGPGFAGPNNDHLSKYTKEPPMADPVATVDPKAFEALTAELKATKDQLAALIEQGKVKQIQYEKAACEQLIGGLVEAGYLLEKEQEVTMLMAIDEAARPARIEYIKKFYKASPVNSGSLGFPVPTMQIGASTDPSSDQARERRDKAVRMATNEKIPFDAAYAKCG